MTETTTVVPSGSLSASRRLLAEPLVHFLILGGLLFALDQMLLERRGDPKRIDVPDTAYEEARALFGNSLKREPTDSDLKVLIDRWVDNEVLYREGLRMGLDKGDSAIRDRVIFKALNVVQADVPEPVLEEGALRQWFEAHRDRYDTPARYDFLEAAVTSDRSDSALRRFVDSLNGRGSSDAQSSLNVFKDRPKANIVQSYGEAFMKGLEAASPQGAWVLLDSSTGPRVVQLLEVKPGISADFNSLRTEILKDWRNEAVSRATTDAVRDLAGQYRIKRWEDR